MRQLLAIVLTALVPAIAAAQEGPDALVKRVTDEVLAVIKSDKDLQAGHPNKVAQLAEAKVLPHFDFERMTRLAVGRGWRGASDAQKQALVKEFRTLLVRTYSNSLTAYRNQAIEVKPTRLAAADTEATVRTQVIQPGGPPIPIDYSMQKAEGGWKVFDVVIDGVSLVTTYRGTFSEQIQKGGIDALVKTLADRNRSPEPPKPPTKSAGAR